MKATGPHRVSDSRNVSAGTADNLTVSGLFAWTNYNVSVQAVTVHPGPKSPYKQVRTLEAGKLRFSAFPFVKYWTFVNLLIFWTRTIRKDLEVSKRKSSSPLYRDSLTSLFWGHFKQYGREENLIDSVVRHVEGIWQHSAWAPTYETLHIIGFSTSALTWFESDFSQRGQFVRIEDATSDILPVYFGVP